MTVLQQRKHAGIETRLYEAPYHTSTASERHMWLYDGKTFFDDNLAKLWNLHETHNKAIMRYHSLLSERRRFIKKPIVVIMDSEDSSVVGGAWIDMVMEDQKKALCMFVIEPSYWQQMHTGLVSLMNNFKCYDSFCLMPARYDPR